jgi:hypothetical protein
MGIAFLGVVGALFLLKTGIVTNSEIIEVHEICGMILGIGIIIHLVLNWKWVRQVYLSRKKMRNK